MSGLVFCVFWRPHLSDLVRPDTWWFAASLTGLFACFLLSLERLPQATETTVAFLGPLCVALAGSRGARELGWVALAAAGVVLLGHGEVRAEALGIVLALMAAASWAAYIWSLSKLGTGDRGYAAIGVANLMAGALVLPFALAEGQPQVEDARAVALQVTAFSLLAGVVVLLAEFEALRRIPNHTFGVLMSLDPAFAALWGFLVLDQTLSATQLVALALVTVGSAGAFSRAPRSATPAA